MAVTPPFTLFQNKTFYISKAVPKRASLVEKVKVNGGRTATRWSANYVVCNPCHPNPPANSISYEFIVEAAASGKLPDIDKHAATAVPPGPPPPSKRRKLHQTASTRLQQGSNNEGARLGPDSGADPDECIIVSDERPRRNPKARHIKVELGEEAEGEASEEGAGFRRNKALLKQIGEVEEVWKNYKGNLDLIVKKVTQQVVKGSEQMTLVTESVATAHTVLGKANEKLMESGLEIAEQQARARAQATNTPAAIDTAASPETSISSSQKKSHKWGGDGAADRGIIAAGLSQQSKYDDDEPWTDKVPSTKPQLKAKGLIDGRAVVRSGRGWFEVEKSLTPETKSQGSSVPAKELEGRSKKSMQCDQNGTPIQRVRGRPRKNPRPGDVRSQPATGTARSSLDLSAAKQDTKKMAAHTASNFSITIGSDPLSKKPKKPTIDEDDAKANESNDLTAAPPSPSRNIHSEAAPKSRGRQIVILIDDIDDVDTIIKHEVSG